VPSKTGAPVNRKSGAARQGRASSRSYARPASGKGPVPREVKPAPDSGSLWTRTDREQGPAARRNRVAPDSGSAQTKTHRKQKPAPAARAPPSGPRLETYVREDCQREWPRPREARPALQFFVDEKRPRAGAARRPREAPPDSGSA
jgi:hypothetical protein